MIPELESLKQLLLNDWDPIGVAESQGIQDEYDAYAMQLFVMLHRGADHFAVTEYLDRIETEHMGLPARHDVSSRIAKQVLRLHQAGSTQS